MYYNSTPNFTGLYGETASWSTPSSQPSGETNYAFAASDRSNMIPLQTNFAGGLLAPPIVIPSPGPLGRPSMRAQDTASPSTDSSQDIPETPRPRPRSPMPNVVFPPATPNSRRAQSLRVHFKDEALSTEQHHMSNYVQQMSPNITASTASGDLPPGWHTPRLDERTLSETASLDGSTIMTSSPDVRMYMAAEELGGSEELNKDLTATGVDSRRDEEQGIGREEAR